jgi:signal transduction histidine kinase
MKLALHSLRLRMMVLFCAVVGVLLAGSFLGFYALLKHEVRAQLDRELLDAAQPVVADLASDPTEQDVAQLNVPNQYFELLDSSGKVVQRSKNLASDSVDLPIETPSGSTPLFRTIRSRHHLRAAYVPFMRGGERNILVLAVPTWPAVRVLDDFGGIVAVLLPLSLLLTALISVWYVGRSLRPIAELTAHAAAITEQLTSSPAIPRELETKFQASLPAAGGEDELERLAATFNTLIARVIAALRQLTQFVSDASHELRTPLSVLRGETELLLSEPRAPEEYQKALEVMDEELKKLSRIVEGLFTLSMADAGELRLAAEPLYLNEVLEDACAVAAPRARAKGVLIERNLAEEVAASGDEAFLRQLFLIFLDNAVKFSPPGAKVSVGLAARDGKARIAFEDHGIGIPPEHLQHIFERFYRAAQSDDGENQSGGLGLAIAQAIARAHGGSIECSSRPGQGSAFIVTLPRTEPPAASA